MTMGAEYSFELISIETYSPQFVGLNKLFLGSVIYLSMMDFEYNVFWNKIETGYEN